MKTRTIPAFLARSDISRHGKWKGRLFNLRPLLIPSLAFTTVSLWRLPLLAPTVTLPAPAVFPQKARPSPYNRRSEVQGTGKRVTVTAPEVPIWVETGRRREELVVHEARRESGHGRVDHVPVIRVRLRGL